MGPELYSFGVSPSITTDGLIKGDRKRRWGREKRRRREKVDRERKG